MAETPTKDCSTAIRPISRNMLHAVEHVTAGYNCRLPVLQVIISTQPLETNEETGDIRQQGKRLIGTSEVVQRKRRMSRAAS